MSPIITQSGGETLRLGVSNFVAFCLGEGLHDPAAPSEELAAMVEALVDTARAVRASAGMLVGMLREQWDLQTGGPERRHDDQSDVYVATVRLLYDQLMRHEPFAS